MKAVLALITISTLFLLGAPPVLALDPSLDISQYAHTAWTVREGFSLGNIYAMAQTPDGYLWLGGEFGLFRFDGVRSVPWQPPAGQHLPEKNINALLVTRDGTLWIGTFAGLVTWSGGKLTPRPEQELAKPVKSSSAGNPDVAFTILKETENDVTGEAICSRKYICAALMHVDEAPFHGSDPETSIAIPEQSIRIDIVVREQSIRTGCASNWIRFDLAVDELQESSVVHGN